jgi:hypothetical protein
MKLVMAVLVFMAPIIVQLIYWKLYSGNWIAQTYGPKEDFFFADPQVTNFLFSFRKGWFIYTPVMVFILIGIPFLYKTARGWFIFSLVFFCINVYILSSWWDWGFGGSFGCRAIIQHYAFFSFGLASFIAVIFNLFDKHFVLKLFARAGLMVVFFCLIVLNYNQSWKYKYALIHHSGMTKEAYFFMFNKDKLTQAELIEYRKLINPPDIEKMLDGERDQ